MVLLRGVRRPQAPPHSNLLWYLSFCIRWLCIVLHLRQVYRALYMILQVVATAHVQAFECRIKSTRTIILFIKAKLTNRRSCNQSPTRALAATTLKSDIQQERKQMEYHIHSRSPTCKTPRGRPLDLVANSFDWRLIIKLSRAERGTRSKESRSDPQQGICGTRRQGEDSGRRDPNEK